MSGASSEQARVIETFVKFWLKGHGYGNLHPAMWSQVACRRIEWRYLDEETGHG